MFGDIIPITFAYMFAYGFLIHDGLNTYLVSELMHGQMKCDFYEPHFNVANMIVYLGISRNQ